ncbi:hypothetical protein AGIG_G25476 [Arapaima gigas]
MTIPRCERHQRPKRSRSRPLAERWPRWPVDLKRVTVLTVSLRITGPAPCPSTGPAGQSQNPDDLRQYLQSSVSPRRDRVGRAGRSWCRLCLAHGSRAASEVSAVIRSFQKLGQPASGPVVFPSFCLSVPPHTPVFPPASVCLRRVEPAAGTSSGPLRMLN